MILVAAAKTKKRRRGSHETPLFCGWLGSILCGTRAGPDQSRHSHWEHKRCLLSLGKCPFEHLHQVHSGCTFERPGHAGLGRTCACWKLAMANWRSAWVTPCPAHGRATRRRAWCASGKRAASRRSIQPHVSLSRARRRVGALADLRRSAFPWGPASGRELNARAIFAAAGVTMQTAARYRVKPIRQDDRRRSRRDIAVSRAGVDSIRHLSTATPIRLLRSPRIR